jgi:hypothetical protein
VSILCLLLKNHFLFTLSKKSIMRILTLALALVATFGLASCGETCKVCSVSITTAGLPAQTTDLGEKCGDDLEALEAVGTQTTTSGGITVTSTTTCK